MRRVIGLIVLLLFTTSYKGEPKEEISFDYTEEIQEIRDNFEEAKKDLGEASLKVNDKKILKKIKRNKVKL